MQEKYLKPLAIMRNRLLANLCIMLLVGSACQNKVVKELYAKPKSLGNVLELGIVAPDSIWQGRQGLFLRTYLHQTGTYTCLPIAPEDTIHFVGLHRNLVHLLTHAQAGKEKTIINQRAFGQTTQYITLPLDSAKIQKMLHFIWQQEKERLRIYKYSFEAFQTTALEHWVGKHYPFKMRILPEFQVWKHTPDMLWLKTDRGEEKHLIISKTKPLPAFPVSKFIVQKHAHKGYQLAMVTPKKERNLPAQRLEMEALLETFEIK